MTLEKKNMPGIGRPKMIVLPFQPAAGQPFDGTGLGLHFFMGNLLGVHGGLAECWFGWRVKKIFPEIGFFMDYCRDHKGFSDIQKLGEQQKVRYWLEGTYRQTGETLFLALVLHDTQEGRGGSKMDLQVTLDDGLLAVRTAFFQWIAACGLAFVGIENAMWPEQISCQGLDCLGRGLEALYLTYIQGEGADSNLIDLTWFDRAVEVSKDSYLVQDLKGWALYKNGEYILAEKAFAAALDLNPEGLGALSGMMFCALWGKDRERALRYSLAKADCRGEDREKARGFVDKKLGELA